MEEQGTCFIEWCWREVTRELFAAFEGMTMRVINDETVLKALIDKHTKHGKDRMSKERIVDGLVIPPIVIPGKSSDAHARSLFRTYRSIKEYGWQETMDSMSRASFYRHVSDICECGISKAALQKLKDQDRKNNVIPLLRFLDVDFSAQRPDWYVDPEIRAA
jgi:II/X family phage/plasmid replication protein